MNNYDYVILFDENGQPYIAHSFWSNAKSWGKKASGRVKGAGKTAHKYLLKVGEGAEARYAYTKAEVDALMGRGRQAVKKVSDTVKRSAVRAADKFGVDERIRRNKALDRYHKDNNVKNAQSYLDANRDYMNTPLGKIDNSVRKARETLKTAAKDLKRGADNLVKNAQSAANRIGTTVKDVKDCALAVHDFVSNANDNQRAYDNVINATSIKERDDARREMNEAAQRVNDAYERYKLTKTGQWLDSHQDDFDRISEKAAAIKSSVETIASSVKEGAEKVGSVARSAADRIDSRDEKRELDAARREYEKVRGTGGEEENNAYWALREAENAYNRTISGRASGAADVASSVAGRVSSAARSAADTVSSAAQKAADRVSGKTKAQAQSEYNAALREYEKVRGTGSGEETDAYWALREAELALERAGGKIKK